MCRQQATIYDQCGHHTLDKQLCERARAELKRSERSCCLFGAPRPRQVCRVQQIQPRHLAGLSCMPCGRRARSRAELDARKRLLERAARTDATTAAQVYGWPTARMPAHVSSRRRDSHIEPVLMRQAVSAMPSSDFGEFLGSAVKVSAPGPVRTTGSKPVPNSSTDYERARAAATAMPPNRIKPAANVHGQAAATQRHGAESNSRTQTQVRNERPLPPLPLEARAGVPKMRRGPQPKYPVYAKTSRTDAMAPMSATIHSSVPEVKSSEAWKARRRAAQKAAQATEAARAKMTTYEDDPTPDDEFLDDLLGKRPEPKSRPELPRFRPEPGHKPGDMESLIREVDEARYAWKLGQR